MLSFLRYSFVQDLVMQCSINLLVIKGVSYFSTDVNKNNQSIYQQQQKKSMSYFSTDVDFSDGRMAENLNKIYLPLLFSPTNQMLLSAKFVDFCRWSVRQKRRVGQFGRLSMFCDGLFVQVRNGNLQKKEKKNSWKMKKRNWNLQFCYNLV